MTTITSPELLTDQTVLWTSIATDISGSTRTAVRNGVVYGWGVNPWSQLGSKQDYRLDIPEPVQELTTLGPFKSVAMGQRFAAYLTQDGRVFVLGDISTISTQGVTAAPFQIDVGEYIVDTISCGPQCLFMVTTDGNLLVIGVNGSTDGNALGIGNVQSTTIPIVVGGESQIGWTKVSSDGQHTVAISAGRLFAWGDNDRGQLGLGVSGSGHSTPQLVVAISPGTLWQEVSVNNKRSAAIFNTILYTWGDNTENLLGLESAPATVTIPTAVSVSLQQFDACTSVSLGSRHAVFVSNGDIYAWGDNSLGVTGIGLTTGITTTPAAIDTRKNWLAVQASDGQNLALAVGDEAPTNLFSWGANSSYATAANTQLGILANPNTVPGFEFLLDPTVDYPTGSKFDISDFTMIFEGELYTWGSNFQSAGGRPSSNIPTTVPQKITTVPGRSWTKCAKGMAIHSGQLYTWGPNADNITLSGTSSGFKSSVSVSTIAGPNWTDVSTATGSSAAGIRNGQLVAWGANTFGISGTLGTGSTSTPRIINSRTDWNHVSVGFTSAAAIRNGRLYEWGQSTLIGTSTVPLQFGTDTDWQWVSAGNRYTLAIKSGRLFAWGSNSGFQTGVGTETGTLTQPTQIGVFEDWSKVIAGNSISIGLRSNGEIYVWGSNLGNWLGIETGAGYFNPPVTQPTRLGNLSDWSDIFVFSSANALFGIRSTTNTWEPLPLHISEPPVEVQRVYSSGFTFNAGTTISQPSKDLRLLPAQIREAIQYTAADFTSLFVTPNTDLFSTGGNIASGTGAPTLASSGGWTFATRRNTVSAGIRNGALFNLDASFNTAEDSGTYTDVAVNQFNRLGVKNGLLYSRGSNSSGITGIGLTSGTTSVLTQVAPELGVGWTAIELNNSLVSRAAAGIFDGRLYAWGDNFFGLTAQGIVGPIFSNPSINVPTQVGSLTGWSQISMGSNHALAIRDGELYGWGANFKGQVGTGVYGGIYSTPTRIGADTDWTHCYAGPEVSLAIRNNQLYVWGSHDLGRTGLGSLTGSSASPTTGIIAQNVYNAVIGEVHGIFTVGVPDFSEPQSLGQSVQTVLNVPQATQLVLANVTISETQIVPRILQVNQYGELLGIESVANLTGNNRSMRGGAILLNSGRTDAKIIAGRFNSTPDYAQVSQDTTTLTQLTAVGLDANTNGEVLVPRNTDKILIFPAGNAIFNFDVASGTASQIATLPFTGPNGRALSPDGQFYYHGGGRIYRFDLNNGSIIANQPAQPSFNATFVPGTNLLLLTAQNDSTIIIFYEYDQLTGNLTQVGTQSPPSISGASVSDICAVRSSVDDVPRLVIFTGSANRVFTIDVASKTLTEATPAIASATTGDEFAGGYGTSPDYRFIFNGRSIFTYDPRSTPMLSRYSNSASPPFIFGLPNLAILDWR